MSRSRFLAARRRASCLFVLCSSLLLAQLSARFRTLLLLHAAPPLSPAVRGAGEEAAARPRPTFGPFAADGGSGVSAWRRVGAEFNGVLVLTDIDDTLWSSGNWRLAGKSLGGIDGDLSRGQTYPGIGALYFLLSSGPHVTAAPVNMMLPTCPTRLASPLWETCPVTDYRSWVLRTLAAASATSASSPFALSAPPASPPPPPPVDDDKPPPPPVDDGKPPPPPPVDDDKPPPPPRVVDDNPPPPPRVDDDKPPLPPRVGLLTARASTSAMRTFTRPASFYGAVETALIHGARQVYGPGVEGWGRVRFENSMELFRDVIGGQHSRGRGKISGFKEALARFPDVTPIFSGDTGEKDVEAAAGMALYAQNKLAAVFVHVVIGATEDEEEAEFEEGHNVRLTPFTLRFNGRRIPSLRLVADVSVLLHPGDPQPTSFASLSDTHLYAAGMGVAGVFKPLMVAYARDDRRQRLKLDDPTNRRAMQEEETLLRKYVGLPIFFLKYGQLDIQRRFGLKRQTTRNPLRKLYKKLSSGLKKGVSKVVSLQWTEEEELRGYIDLSDVPSSGNFSQADDLGVPFIPYRTALGAGISAFVLEMLTLQDLVNLAVAAIRDYRSLGPAEACAQKEVLDDLFFDLHYMQDLAGDALRRARLENRAIFEDGVEAIRTFRSQSKKFCIPMGPSLSWALGEDVGACLALFHGPTAPQSAAGASGAYARGAVELAAILPAVAPLARAACTFMDQMKYWKSAGGDELEVLSLKFSLALNQAVELSNDDDISARQSSVPSRESSTRAGADLNVPDARPPSLSDSGFSSYPLVQEDPSFNSSAVAASPMPLLRPSSGTVNVDDSWSLSPGLQLAERSGSSSAGLARPRASASSTNDRRRPLEGAGTRAQPLVGYAGLAASLAPSPAAERRPETLAVSKASTVADSDLGDDEPDASLFERRSPTSVPVRNFYIGATPPDVSVSPRDLRGDMGGKDLSPDAAATSSLSPSAVASINECPYPSVRKLLLVMRPICEKQQKNYGLAAPCAVMSRLLYDDGVLDIFAEVAAWMERGAKTPLYLPKLHLTLDPEHYRLGTLMRKENSSFRNLRSVLTRGRGHHAYNLIELKRRHRSCVCGIMAVSVIPEEQPRSPRAIAFVRPDHAE
ncbi:hypothetical protein BESB_073590 [Besnoitia besnoiti]|uniref:Uncharacterized protein n=1 Tax=Besnoitia besnoiti TaxID=94643 RepID=A0A2A9MEZ8_BESBE|nr:uncharacterized protein BESB_073590 [Besnoitia besnoiti]PFH34207.1 hypothetical protein BESB_073590 [Besnoitia besnoiti]